MNTKKIFDITDQCLITWQELDGKTLKIHSIIDKDYTFVFGIDEEGIAYFLEGKFKGKELK